jgi:hypothetical protein
MFFSLGASAGKRARRLDRKNFSNLPNINQSKPTHPVRCDLSDSSNSVRNFDPAKIAGHIHNQERFPSSSCCGLPLVGQAVLRQAVATTSSALLGTTQGKCNGCLSTRPEDDPVSYTDLVACLVAARFTMVVELRDSYCGLRHTIK